MHRLAIIAALAATFLCLELGLCVEVGLCAEAPLADIGRVKNIAGTVSVERGGHRLAVVSGTQLESGDVIITGPDGRMGITFVDNTRFSVGYNSRVILKDFHFDPTRRTGSFVTSVNRGTLGVVSGLIAKSGKDAMRVATPTSMLGVRGTRFVVDVP